MLAASVPVAGYGSQVARAGQASYAERTFSDRDAREYGRAADEWVAAGRSGRKRFKRKYYDRERRRFVRDNPRSRRLRPTVRRWEDHFNEVQAIRDAKPVRPSWGEVLVAPKRARRQSDRLIVERLVRNGSSQPVYRAMVLGKKPGSRFEHRRLSSWTPHEAMADKFAAQHMSYVRRGLGSTFANHPKDLDRGSARAYVVSARMRSANVAPLSRFANVDERISVRRRPDRQVAREWVGKSVGLLDGLVVAGSRLG